MKRVLQGTPCACCYDCAIVITHVGLLDGLESRSSCTGLEHPATVRNINAWSTGEASIHFRCLMSAASSPHFERVKHNGGSLREKGLASSVTHLKTRCRSGSRFTIEVSVSRCTSLVPLCDWNFRIQKPRATHVLLLLFLLKTLASFDSEPHRTTPHD